MTSRLRQCLPGLLMLWVLVASVPVPGEAHEVRPAYLRLKALGAETTPDQYEVLWRKPINGEVRLDISPKLPDNCRDAGERTYWTEGGAEVLRWNMRCAGGIEGQLVQILGLSATVTDVLVRYERGNGTTQVERLSPDEPSLLVTASETWSQVAGTYFVLGVEHILLGIDHLLFVLALLMIVANGRKLVATVTSFTLAHSITLAAATLGLVHVPQKPVEAVIALSIMFVAMEIVHWRQGRPGLTRRAPWIVAFTFGLLHGFGFAGALSEIGLPEHAIPSALLFFNVGVEAGQLLFVGGVLLTWAGVRRIPWPDWAWRVPVYGIGSMAAFWTIDRLSGFVP